MIDIRSYLEEVYTLEVVNSTMGVIEFLDKLGDTMITIERIITDNEYELATSDIMNLVKSFLYRDCLEYFERVGVVVDGDILLTSSFTTILTLMNALHNSIDIDDCDLEDVAVLLIDDDSNYNILLSILSLKSETITNEFNLLVEDVDDIFLSNIREQVRVNRITMPELDSVDITPKLNDLINLVGPILEEHTFKEFPIELLDLLVDKDIQGATLIMASNKIRASRVKLKFLSTTLTKEDFKRELLFTTALQLPLRYLLDKEDYKMNMVSFLNEFLTMPMSQLSVNTIDDIYTTTKLYNELIFTKE